LQPYFAAKDKENATNEMYIILDNSFSMQAKGKQGELLKRAVQELLEETLNYFSLLTNSENFGIPILNQLQHSSKPKYNGSPFQLAPIMARIKSHKSIFKKILSLLQML
jgi:hypothetical protein